MRSKRTPLLQPQRKSPADLSDGRCPRGAILSIVRGCLLFFTSQYITSIKLISYLREIFKHRQKSLGTVF